mmetsp:Transcript_11153/g.37975  ORF Transcript_11153/g.37975 Transcript_11153/m.37975 type:complete len:94 (-) Transcript_11153:333-614(-)
MYTTTSHDIGFRAPQTAQLPTKWFAQSGTFSKEFMNANKFGESRKTFTTLNTSMVHNPFHHALDQGWRGDAHASSLYVTTGARRPLGSGQRLL